MPVTPVLINDNQEHAQKVIDEGTQNLPLLNTILTAYKTFGLEREIITEADVKDLHYNFDQFIEVERLKSIPSTISGVPIDRLEFMNKMVPMPAGMDAFKEQVNQLARLGLPNFQFLIFNATTKLFIVNSAACDQFKLDIRQFARGNQVLVLNAATKLMEAYDELMAAGLHPEQIFEPIDMTYHAVWRDGRPYRSWRLKPKGFCLMVQPGEEV